MSENSNGAQETVDAAMAARFREIRRFYAKTQLGFAKLFKISRSTVSDIEREHINPPKALLVSIVGKGDFTPGWVINGDLPKFNSEVEEDNLVTGVLPQHIEEAWLILHEAATKGGADLMAAEDQRDVGEAIATIAQGVSKGTSQEGRLRLARTAERLLLTIGKIPR